MNILVLAMLRLATLERGSFHLVQRNYSQGAIPIFNHVQFLTMK